MSSIKLETPGVLEDFRDSDSGIDYVTGLPMQKSSSIFAMHVSIM
jgi:hypothetical protein